MIHDPHDPGGVKLQAIVDAVVALAHDRGMEPDMPCDEYNQFLYDIQVDVHLSLPYKVREEKK